MQLGRKKATASALARALSLCYLETKTGSAHNLYNLCSSASAVMSKARVIYFGEYHNNKTTIKAQLELMKQLAGYNISL